MRSETNFKELPPSHNTTMEDGREINNSEQTAQLSINSPLCDIVQDIAEFYKQPYKQARPSRFSKKAPTKRDIEREAHGPGHMARVSIGTTILVNLYRRHDDPEALKLTEEQVKLLAITAAMHDIAREGDGKDIWDNHSAAFCYGYLIDTLGVDRKTAKRFAEAIANKDISDTYNELVEQDGTVTWSEKSINPGTFKKDIIAQILHDADCLDVMRARFVFDGTQLDFYKKIASKYNRKLAFEEMAWLICEWRSLITTQGDTYKYMDLKVKRRYDLSDNVYNTILADIKKQSKSHPMLPALFADGKLLSKQDLYKLQLLDPALFADGKLLSKKELDAFYQPDAEFSIEQLRGAIHEGNVLARGIAYPLSRVSYPKHQKSKPKETKAELEIRKTLREIGVATHTQKLDRHHKQGNNSRSLAGLTNGSTIFSPIGFLTINPDFSKIKYVCPVDFGSGYGKKRNLSPMSPQLIKSSFAALIKEQKLGGTQRTLKHGRVSKHTEVIYHIEKSDLHFIYYCNDPCLMRARKQPHENTFLLKAIYLQQAYRAKSRIILPIVEYSSIHNYVIVRDYDSKAIEKLWLDIVSDYIKKQLDTGQFYSISQLPIEDIKILAFAHTDASHYDSADKYYPQSLQKVINRQLVQCKDDLLEQYQSNILGEIQSLISSATESQDPVELDTAEAELDTAEAELDTFEAELGTAQEYLLAIVKKIFSHDNFFIVHSAMEQGLLSQQFQNVLKRALVSYVQHHLKKPEWRNPPFDHFSDIWHCIDDNPTVLNRLSQIETFSIAAFSEIGICQVVEKLLERNHILMCWTLLNTLGHDTKSLKAAFLIVLRDWYDNSFKDRFLNYNLIRNAISISLIAKYCGHPEFLSDSDKKNISSYISERKDTQHESLARRFKTLERLQRLGWPKNEIKEIAKRLIDNADFDTLANKPSSLLIFAQLVKISRIAGIDDSEFLTRILQSYESKDKKWNPRWLYQLKTLIKICSKNDPNNATRIIDALLPRFTLDDQSFDCIQTFIIVLQKIQEFLPNKQFTTQQIESIKSMVSTINDPHASAIQYHCSSEIEVCIREINRCTFSTLPKVCLKEVLKKRKTTFISYLSIFCDKKDLDRLIEFITKVPNIKFSLDVSNYLATKIINSFKEDQLRTFVNSPRLKLSLLGNALISAIKPDTLDLGNADQLAEFIDPYEQANTSNEKHHKDSEINSHEADFAERYDSSDAGIPVIYSTLFATPRALLMHGTDITVKNKKGDTSKEALEKKRSISPKVFPLIQPQQSKEEEQCSNSQSTCTKTSGTTTPRS